MKYNLIDKNNKNSIKNNYYIPITNNALNQKSIKIDGTYFIKKNYLNKNYINYKPLVNYKSNKYIKRNKGKIMFKKIFDYNKKEIGLYNHQNSSKDCPDFIYKTYNNNDDIEINMKNENKNIKTKIPSLNLRKKTYDFKKEEKNNLTNRKANEYLDTTCEAKYIEYLFKLYQPKNKFQTFINNVSNIKIKKK